MFLYVHSKLILDNPMPDNKCDFCGKHELLPFKCRYCGGQYCVNHRLPENHSCQGLKRLKERSWMEPVHERNMASPVRRANRKKMPALKLPASGYYAYMIIGITVLIYLLQVMLGEWFTDSLYLSGGTLLTRPWGLVTHMFLHGSMAHIFFNMLTLFFFGPFLERQVGSRRFLMVYFGSGILAGLMQVLIFPNPVVGASGAIFGVLGALTVLMPDLRIYLFFVPMKILYAVILFAIFDLLLFTMPGIAHAAHLTGLVIGVVMGYWYKKKPHVFEQVYWNR